MTVTNVSDNNPASIKKSVPVDFISASANYDNESQTLTIKASSSDSIHPIILTVADLGIGELPIPVDGMLKLNLISVPANVTILSTAGGKIIIPVVVT